MKLLKKFNRGVQGFLYKHPNFGIRRLMLYVIIGNALIWLFSQMDRTGMLTWYLALIPSRVLRGEVWRLVTFIFVPSAGRPLFLLLELYFYYLIGTALEQAWGCGKFTVYYLCGMILSILYGFIAALFGSVYAVTGSYISLSMFFVYATLWPDNRVLLFFIIPVKVKWLAWFEAALFLLSMISMRTLLPLVGIANYFLFCGDILLDSLQRLRGRNSRASIRFRRKITAAKNEQAVRPYTRRCLVCGRTDTEYPGLEFRYCSKCAGYRCYCADHIQDHTHYTEP